MNYPENPTTTSFTPESFAATNPAYANLGRRILAHFLDGQALALINLGLIAVVIYFPWESDLPLLAAIVLAIFVSWFYYALFESSRWQATLGKKLFGLKVTDCCGQRISFWRASLRTLGRVASNLSFGLGYLSCLFSEQHRTWHDYVAGTLVLQNAGPSSPDSPSNTILSLDLKEDSLVNGTTQPHR